MICRQATYVACRPFCVLSQYIYNKVYHGFLWKRMKTFHGALCGSFKNVLQTVLDGVFTKLHLILLNSGHFVKSACSVVTLLNY